MCRPRYSPGMRDDVWINVSTCTHSAGTMLHTPGTGPCQCDPDRGGCGQRWQWVTGRGYVPLNYRGDATASRVAVNYTPRT